MLGRFIRPDVLLSENAADADNAPTIVNLLVFDRDGLQFEMRPAQQ